MDKGKINVTTENIFPIIKKYLYSDHEIFLRELISNAIDATQKLKALSSVDEYKGDMTDLIIRVSLDKKKKTLTVSDNGIGMTKEEIDKYINQIAFSSAEEFLEKYKDKTEAIIGHFGLGFYSSFMVSEKVEIISKSYKENEKSVKWECDGSPEYTIDKAEKKKIGTDVILHIDDDSKEFLEENKINELLKKYCKFLPVEIAFGKEIDYKDGKSVETDKDKIINNTKPAWTRKPAELKDEDYKEFYRELYPIYEDPLFNIHLNVDYPFNLTGILYFPRIKKNIEIQKNKIQLYSRQVFVTDSVEGIVPEFLTLLHGVLDSPDIPLNVSRSFLQNDSNVKKISSHITKKVADRLNEIFKNDREEFEKKWDDLKLFIEFGMITEDKFFDRAKSFSLLKNTDNKYFTFEEYKNLIKENQTDKNNSLIYLYSTNSTDQYSYIEAAKSKGYDVLLFDGQYDTHFLNHLEQKFENSRFVRVDAEIVNKLIEKDKSIEIKLNNEQQDDLRQVFLSQLPKENTYLISYEGLDESEAPMLITQSEFIRRMKDMSALNAGMQFYNQMPDTYNLVINANHPLILKIEENKEKKIGEKVQKINDEIKPVKEENEKLKKAKEGKKEEEITQAEKDKIEDLEKNINELNNNKQNLLKEYGKKNKIVKQLIDLALISNNMLKGEELTKFVKRSVELIKL
ncbi:MAG: molecular chaperone HtpG [Bacteroidales bacterium]|nr:molecular chaperone HtpG [Bacteroidales bacterium]